MISATETQRDVLRIIHRYAEAIESRDWIGIADIFSPRIQWTWPDSTTTTGREAVISELKLHIEALRASHHLLGCYNLVTAATSASVSVHRRSYFQGDDDLFMESLGKYLVEFEFDGSNWQIVRFAELVLVRRGTRDVFSRNQ